MGLSACTGNRKPVVDKVKVVMLENEISVQKLNVIAAGTAWIKHCLKTIVARNSYVCWFKSSD